MHVNLRYSTKLPHPRIRMGKGLQRLVEFACTWSHKLRKLSTNGDQKDELPFDTDKPLIAYYMALGCLDG